MNSNITVEALPLLGVCNLCLAEGAVKSMLSRQKFNGTEEKYADILFKCFNIDILTMDFGDTKKAICELCISKLGDTLSFKMLMETSLRTLENTSQTLNVKVEVEDQIDNGEDDGFTFEDDEVIADLLIKSEAFDSPINKPAKGKSKLKRKLDKNSRVKYNSKHKIGNVKGEDHLKMLAKGLFPFKLNKNDFGCAVCPERCDSLDVLRDHVLLHREKFIQVAFKRSVVGTSSKFFFLNNLNFCCKTCSTEVSNYDEMKDHIDICTTEGATDRRWRENLPFKLDKNQLDCPVCKKIFLNFVSLNTHMNMHYPNYVCESCGKAFASKGRLRAHMRTHEIGEFPCKFCGAVFDRVTRRENHVSKDHKAGIRYVCKRCNLPLSSFYARQKHMAEVHNEELKRYKCKACTQSYVTPGHLSSHVRRDHLNERNYKCEKCDLAFYTRNSLKMHMIKHDGERIHACSICQKSYQRKKTLKEHMRIHNNDKRFICPYCGRAFTQKCTLKGHLKVHDKKPDLDLERRISQPLHSI